MPQQQVRVTFQPSGRSVYVLSGTKVLEAAGRAGLTIETPCGGAGTCGKCRVRIVRGACPPTPAEEQHLADDEREQGWRLACQACICAEAVVDVPASSLFGDGHRILTQTAGGQADVRPAVRKVHVELPEPTLEDDDADLVRLERAIGPVEADLSLLRRLGTLLRENRFRGTAVITDHRLIDFEPGDTADDCYGVALDIGTTTVVASLLHLCSGQERAIVSGINPQVAAGDDVVSRISHAARGQRERAELRDCLVEALAGMIDQLCRRAGIARERIYEVALAGNTTMEHLLCGSDVRQLGEVPFVPVHGRGLVLWAEELGLSVHPRAAAYVFPVIGGFVGGDTVAGLLSTGLADQDGPSLMIDIGTNGEIALVHAGELWAASTAAGPAFEGARISCGMRATAGAIEKAVLDDDLQVSVIGNAPPIGICGSALVDLAAGLLDAGILAPQGALRTGDELPPGLGEALRRRVRAGANGQPEFVLADGADAPNPITVTQRDIRELQLAVGAIRAGTALLLQQAGLRGGDLQRVLIAGGFGSFIRRNHAQRIGLLPPDVPHNRVQCVGNAALSGVRWALLSTTARERAEALARRARHVDLSQDPQFQMQFAEAMLFPEG